MRRLDWRKRISFVDLSGAETVCPLDRRAMLERFRAREGDGPLLSGAAAFAAMWRAIPLLRPLGLAARSGLVLRVIERLYLMFLRVRPVSPALAAVRGLS